MKIIGEGTHGKWIAEVSREEIEKLFDKWYPRDDKDRLPKFEVGMQIDLGAAHNFRSDIQSSCYTMKQAMESFERGRQTMHRFAIMIAERVETEVKPNE